MKKFAILLLLFAIATIPSMFQSCDSCHGEKFDSKFFAKNMNGEVYNATESLNDTSHVKYSDLQIDLTFSGASYRGMIKKTEIIPSLYACSPPDLVSMEKAQDIIITANKDYDSAHIAGSNLKDIFYISRYHYSEKMTIDEYFQRKRTVENISLSLISAPENDIDIQFTISYRFLGRYTNHLDYKSQEIHLTR